MDELIDKFFAFSSIKEENAYVDYDEEQECYFLVFGVKENNREYEIINIMNIEDYTIDISVSTILKYPIKSERDELNLYRKLNYFNTLCDLVTFVYDRDNKKIYLKYLYENDTNYIEPFLEEINENIQVAFDTFDLIDSKLTLNEVIPKYVKQMSDPLNTFKVVKKENKD